MLVLNRFSLSLIIKLDTKQFDVILPDLLKASQSKAAQEYRELTVLTEELLRLKAKV
jgi:hypothetical protein